jgi:HEPN domain-containing protein
MGERARAELSAEAQQRFFGEYLGTAADLLEDAEERFRRRRYPAVVAAVQEALEFVVKGLFHWAGLAPPRSHRLGSPEFARDLRRLQDEVTSQLGTAASHRLQLSRVIFLADFWATARILARYGSEATGATPSQLFKRREASLALSHLREAGARLEQSAEAARMDLLDTIAARLEARQASDNDSTDH